MVDLQKSSWYSINRIKDAFYRFRQDPYNRFVVNVRRYRAEGIRTLFAERQAMDLQTFQREAWDFETGSFWLRLNISIAVFQETKSGRYVKTLIEKGPEIISRPLTWADLEEALRQGDLELHGHYIWHQGGKIYEAGRKSEEQKVAQIHRAISVLNDSRLFPLEKEKNLRDIGGFGECNATGLVMIFHPDEFSIVNPVTREAYQRFGVPLGGEASLEANQKLLFFLKEELGALDFLELDWFLFRVKEGDYAELMSPFVPVTDEELEVEEKSPDHIPTSVSLKSEVNKEFGKIRRLSLEDPVLTHDTGYDLHRARARSSAFANAIKRLYGYKCAVCGAGARGPKFKEQTEVESAHIYPKSLKGSDDLRNGLCLCRKHHWAFDVGWFMISEDYTIIIDKNLPCEADYDFIREWENKKISPPRDEVFRPHPKFIKARRDDYRF